MCLDNDFIISKGFSKYHKLLLYFRTHVNGTIQTWDVKTGRKLNSFTVAPIAKTDTMILSPDATLFAVHGRLYAYIVPARNGYHVERTASRGINTTRLWNLKISSEMNPLQVEFRPNLLRFSPDNRLLVTTQSFNGPSLWDVITGRKLFQFNVHDNVIVFSSDSKILAIGGDSDVTRIWNVKSGNEIVSLNSVTAKFLAFSPDNKTLAIATHTEIHLWNLNEAQTSTSMLMEKDTKINALTFSPDGNTLLVGVMERTNEPGIWNVETIYGFQLWDVQTTNILASYSGHSDEIRTLTFSHDGKTIASSSKDGTVILWDWDKILAKIKPDDR